MRSQEVRRSGSARWARRPRRSPLRDRQPTRRPGRDSCRWPGRPWPRTSPHEPTHFPVPRPSPTDRHRRVHETSNAANPALAAQMPWRNPQRPGPRGPGAWELGPLVRRGNGRRQSMARLARFRPWPLGEAGVIPAAFDPTVGGRAAPDPEPLRQRLVGELLAATKSSLASVSAFLATVARTACQTLMTFPAPALPAIPPSSAGPCYAGQILQAIAQRRRTRLHLGSSRK